MTPELTQEQSHFSADNDVPERLSPGALIRHARERARMAPEELAAQTKLARSVLDALERDDFNTLIEPVYVRGYYRKCAKVLNVSEKELLDAYEARVAPRAPALPAKLRLASGTELGTGSRLPIPLAAVGAAAAIIICALIWFARGEPNNAVPPAVSAKADAMAPEATPSVPAIEPASAVTSAESLALSPSVTAVEPVVPAPAAPVVAPAPVAAAPVSSPAVHAPANNPLPLVSAQSLATKPAAAASAVVPTPAVKPATPAAAAPVASAASVTPKPVAGSAIALSFSITSWARVDDASGKTLLNGLMRSGEKQNLSGTAPFTVFLGNAPGVRAELNGKSVDLTKYTAANNTARFTLGGKP